MKQSLFVFFIFSCLSFAAGGKGPSLSLKDRVSYFLSGSQRALKSTLVRCQSVMSRTDTSAVAFLKRNQTLNRVQVPPAQETEAGLRARGFREVHIAGMDEVHRMEAIAHALRTNRVDPNMTHIEDFAAQVEGHIAFFKRSGKVEEAIEKLAREARQMVRDKKVTYNWWMQWNTKMVETAEDLSKKDPHAIYDFSFDSDIFNMQMGNFQTKPFSSDSIVFLPTTKELGVMAFNQASSKKLIPLGLTDRVTEADGLPFGPMRFLKHDINHGRNVYRPRLVENKRYKDFHKSFREKVKDLPKPRREKLETMLFVITHEYPYAVQSVSQFADLSDSKLIDRRGDFFASQQKFLPPSLQNVVPNSNDYYNAVYSYHKSMLDEFETIARDIQKGR